MSVSQITAVGRVEPPSTTSRPPDNPRRTTDGIQSHAPVQTGSEESTTRRFPWLSWQTRELEAASKQPSPYGKIPLLGLELDQKG